MITLRFDAHARSYVLLDHDCRVSSSMTHSCGLQVSAPEGAGDNRLRICDPRRIAFCDGKMIF
ncbi:MAG: hypothetical protein KGS44_16615, partial [Alphaproteobacteria bacterium]|nr:hypothetical protein [Alphaproteobacteria bacterium]